MTEIDQEYHHDYNETERLIFALLATFFIPVIGFPIGVIKIFSGRVFIGLLFILVSFLSWGAWNFIIYGEVW